MNHFFRQMLGFAALLCSLPGCGSDGMDSASGTDGSLGAPNPAPLTSDAQTPPNSDGKAVEAWLAAGSYLGWSCELQPHAQMKVSPHGQNKICSNELESKFAGAAGSERPVGSAAVKELYDDSATLVGYAVAVKVKPASDSGAGWYWYERVPLSSPVPHDSKGVVADGLGSKGAAQTICVGCHGAAALDDTHTVIGSGDFVYDQIPAR